MFMMELGVLEEVKVDGSKDKNSPGTEFMKCCWSNDILLTRNNPERPNQKPEEGVIMEFQRRWLQNMIRKRFPRNLWDYGDQWTTQVM